jgi:hypothetical protein
VNSASEALRGDDFRHGYGRVGPNGFMVDVQGQPNEAARALQGEGEITEHRPDIIERMGGAIASALTAIGFDNYDAQKHGRKIAGMLDALTPLGNVNSLFYGESELEQQLSILPLPGPVRAAVKKGIRAYHGSPHDFDRFSRSNLGTGEGNLAYGDGLYFAENPNVASNYVQSRGASPLSVAPEIRDPLLAEMKSLDYLGFDNFGESLAAMRTAPLDFAERFDVPNPERLRSLFDVYENARWPQGYRPRLYEVNINASPNDFIDYDTAGAANAFRAAKAGDAPGIRYLDQNSRSAGAGTSNYVVFDDSLIDILSKR